MRKAESLFLPPFLMSLEQIRCTVIGGPYGLKERYLTYVGQQHCSPPSYAGAYIRHQFNVHDKSFDVFSTTSVLRYRSPTDRLPDEQPMDSVLIVHEVNNDGLGGYAMYLVIRRKYPMMPIAMVSFCDDDSHVLHPDAYMDEHTELFNVHIEGDREQLIEPFVYLAKKLNK